MGLQEEYKLLDMWKCKAVPADVAYRLWEAANVGTSESRERRQAIDAVVEEAKKKYQRIFR